MAVSAVLSGNQWAMTDSRGRYLVGVNIGGTEENHWMSPAITLDSSAILDSRAFSSRPRRRIDHVLIVRERIIRSFKGRVLLLCFSVSYGRLAVGQTLHGQVSNPPAPDTGTVSRAGLKLFETRPYTGVLDSQDFGARCGPQRRPRILCTSLAGQDTSVRPRTSHRWRTRRPARVPWPETRPCRPGPRTGRRSPRCCRRT